MRTIAPRHWGWALAAAAALHAGGALLLAAGAPSSEFSGGHDRVLAVSLSRAGAETPTSPLPPTQTAARLPPRAFAAPSTPPAKAAPEHASTRPAPAPTPPAVDTTTPPAPAEDAAARELRGIAPARAVARAAAPEAEDVASPPALPAPTQPASAGSDTVVGAVAPPARSSSATGRPGDAVYDDYVGRIRRQLEASKRYPRRARQQRLEGTVLLEFAIDRSGAVTRHRIVASAGHAALDGAVERMLRRAAPLPAMPPELPGPGLELRIPVVFDLR